MLIAQIKKPDLQNMSTFTNKYQTVPRQMWVFKWRVMKIRGPSILNKHDKQELLSFFKH